MERITQRIETKKDSEKKILNTSKPLAPTARRIPISRFFWLIETEIKLDRSNAENMARIIPAQRKILDITSMNPFMVSKL